MAYSHNTQSFMKNGGQKKCLDKARWERDSLKMTQCVLFSCNLKKGVLLILGTLLEVSKKIENNYYSLF